MRNVIIGVYDHPPPPNDGLVEAKQIPDTEGPFRLKEYGKGFAALTKARDKVANLVSDLVP